MTKMLTAKDIQDLLQVDRSTVYRLAEAGRLPAIKVGRQWRFPEDQFNSWYQRQTMTTTVANGSYPPSLDLVASQSCKLTELLPHNWLQLVQDAFASLLGVMLVVTDIEGNPLTQPSNPCGLFTAISQQSKIPPRYVQGRRDASTLIDLTPEFRTQPLGLLWARSMIVLGTELRGMVIAGCVAPDEWPLSQDNIEDITSDLDVQPEVFRRYANNVYHLDEAQRDQVLATLPRIATIIAYVAYERKEIVDRIETIADLAHVGQE